MRMKSPRELKKLYFFPFCHNSLNEKKINVKKVKVKRSLSREIQLMDFMLSLTLPVSFE
jgi:hypothetical protein